MDLRQSIDRVEWQVLEDLAEEDEANVSSG